LLTKTPQLLPPSNIVVIDSPKKVRQNILDSLSHKVVRSAMKQLMSDLPAI
jgi:hypothetical protein